MFRSVSAAIVGLLLYGVVIIPFTSYLHEKPTVEKLGYVPSVKGFKTVAYDFKELVAASLVLKVMMYYGGLLEKADTKLSVPPDYQTMSRILHGSVQLDPYNMDAYYFAQSFLTWDVKQYKLANDLLVYGMKYRSWDWNLPFFAGFNSAYFLKDYPAAARYYQRAGELGGPDVSRMLAGRYLQEAGQTDLAIAYLTAMARQERNPGLKRDYQRRLAAFRETRRIEIARDNYRAAHGSLPASVPQLVQAGLLPSLPKDPYGGEFYFEPGGKVTTTSKYAFIVKNSNQGKGGAAK